MTATAGCAVLNHDVLLNFSECRFSATHWLSWGIVGACPCVMSLVVVGRSSLKTSTGKRK
jgi:hypothetical protein